MYLHNHHHLSFLSHLSQQHHQNQFNTLHLEPKTSSSVAAPQTHASFFLSQNFQPCTIMNCRCILKLSHNNTSPPEPHVTTITTKLHSKFYSQLTVANHIKNTSTLPYFLRLGFVSPSQIHLFVDFFYQQP
ncbi:hypothetical protein MKX03_011335, partial [Papaver bracteatum]